MKKTFTCDESMVITIPIGSLKDMQEGQLMPEKFHCVFRDVYKVFVIKGKPKPLGAKLSFSMNIISFFWSLVAVCLCSLTFPVLSSDGSSLQVLEGIKAIIVVLLVIEKIMALVLIYWLSKAICRENFNILPLIRLKQGV
ncbi:hypothetical protein LDENG_00186330 [Lucifuga dentata]|nr:hypothetical protein LDENG_00186330 [Lucifuga dentata]